VPGERAFVDLHCHTSASFDSLAVPGAVVRAAVSRGLTHLAITDHDRIDGALQARERAAAEAPGLVVIIGQEIRTTAGDLIGLFLGESIQPGLSPAEAIAAVRARDHAPLRSIRGSVGRASCGLEDRRVLDWIETWCAHARRGKRARQSWRAVGVPGSVSDAHTTMEVGIAATILAGDPGTPDGLRAALAGPMELVTGRASAYVRLIGPVAKLVQRARGRGVPPTMATR
jgi:hypothetical protein